MRFFFPTEAFDKIVKVKVQVYCTQSEQLSLLNSLLEHIWMFYGSISITRFSWSD